MVKKLHLLTVAGMMAATTVSAQAPELKWVSAQDGAGTESPLQIQATNDGNVFVLADFDSSAKEGKSQTTDFWHYNMVDGSKTSAVTLTGAAETTSANGAKALAFYKMDATTGKMAWAINTTLGDGAGKGAIAATPDGGAVLALKMRHSNKNLSLAPEVLCEFADQKGNKTTVNWTAPGESWVYQPVLVKVSAAGAVEWAKHIEATGDFEIQNVVADAEAVYVAGCTKGAMNWGEKANLKTANTKGDLYVVKLDATGTPVWNATSTSSNEVKGYRLALNGDKLYVAGYIKGEGEVKFGTSTVTPSALKNLFVANLSTTDGTFAWAKTLNGAKNTTGKQEIKCLALTAADKDLYIGGSFTGDLMNGTDKFLSNDDDANENSFIVKCNATDGTFQNGLRIRPSETSTKMYIGQLQSIYTKDNKVLATGQVMAIGSLLYEMDTDLTAASLKTSVLVENNGGASFGSALVGDMLVTTSKAKPTATIPGFKADLKTIGSWSCVFTGHSLKGDATGIEGVEAGNEGAQVIYDLSGRRVAKAVKGLYIINGKKVFVR